MDGTRFDDVTRSLVRSGSRRGFLAGLVGLAAGLLGGAAAGAQTSCPPDQVNRRGIGCVCRNTGRPPGAGGCSCPAGLTRCDVDGVCVDTSTDAANCGGCDLACTDLEDCQAGECVARSCANTVLSGGPSPTDTITVDDDLEVQLNGVAVFTDDDEVATVIPPIALGTTTNGDQLRVIASNSAEADICEGGFDSQSLSPLYLHCTDTGAVQTLDADGHPAETAGGCDVVFYNTVFTVAL